MIGRAIILCVFLAFIRGSGTAAQQGSIGDYRPPWTVLVLHSYDRGLPAYERFDSVLIEAFRERGFPASAVSYEYLDVSRFPDKASLDLAAASLRLKYGARPPSIIIAVNIEALNVAVDPELGLFPGVPVVAMDVPPNARIPGGDRNVMILDVTINIDGILRAARSLVPKAKRVIVVVGDSPGDASFEAFVRQVEPSWAGELDFEYTKGLTIDRVVNLAANAGEDTIVLFVIFFRDAAGSSFVPREAAKRIVESSAVPVFGIFETYMEAGIAGGVMSTFYSAGRTGVDWAVRLLRDSGSARGVDRTRYETIPLFDYEALARWRLDPQRLPAGAVVLNQPTTFWSKYGSYAAAGAIFMLLETVLVSVLLMQKRRRKLAELALRDSERNYRDIFENSALGMFQVAADGHFIKANQSLAGIFGYPSPAELIAALPDAREAVIDIEEMNRRREAVDREGAIQGSEIRIRDKAGRTVWISLNARQVLDSKGDFVYYEGTIGDITARKAAEERIAAALAEKESLLHELYHRTRNNMQMILSIISLESKKIDNEKMLALLDATQNRIRAIGAVHDLLIGAEDLSCVDFGLYVDALADMYRQIMADNRVVVATSVPDKPISVAIDTAVPLGLALGELFANSIQHAFPDGRRGRVDVAVKRMESGVIEIDFSDDGVGLPAGIDAVNARSLGLTLMRELVVNQLGGCVTVESGVGTRYRLSITEKGCSG